MPHIVPILFLFALGACIGSFLNVVVWRLPRDESLVTPPSRCPKCGNQLKWYDNVPVFGWMWLRGKCRFCAQPISARYPIVEAITGLLFVFYYVMYFLPAAGQAPPWPASQITVEQTGRLLTCGHVEFADGWPIYALYMLAISVLLAASLIDAENFFIPIGMLWYLLIPIAIAWHAITDRPTSPGTLIASAPTSALAAGGGIGVLLSYLLWRFGLLPTSFADGGPLLEIERAERDKEIEAAKAEGRKPELPEEEPSYTPAQVRREMRKEMLFLFPPILLAGLFVILTLKVPALRDAWDQWTARFWIRAMFGSIFGLLIGGFVVWITRILGTLAFGREAMGMGDVHLMAGVGAVIGAGASTVAFFIAPFFGIALAVYMLLTGKRRELPYGPYLSLGTAAVMVFYCDIANWLAPGLIGMRMVVSGWFT